MRGDLTFGDFDSKDSGLHHEGSFCSSHLRAGRRGTPPRHLGQRRAAGQGSLRRCLHKRRLRLRRDPRPGRRRSPHQLPLQPARLLRLPVYRESFRGSFVTTNLNTGGTFTNVFAGSSKDQTIVDNGDGTITITVYATGGSRWYDQHGRLVLKDPGNIRFAFDIDYNGTPGNPEDDMDVSNSFRIVRESTGRNDTEGRDFCADLVQFTGAPG